MKNEVYEVNLYKFVCHQSFFVSISNAAFAMSPHFQFGILLTVSSSCIKVTMIIIISPQEEKIDYFMKDSALLSAHSYLFSGLI